MTFAEVPTAVKEFRSTPCKFRQTFKTPLKNLPQFVAAIVATDQAFQTASVIIEQTVFEPRHWIDLMTRYSLPPRYEKGVSVTAAGQQEIEAVLGAVFSDWVDFVFIPIPTPFVIYADHDEYTTFYAESPTNLNRIAEVLTAKGLKGSRGTKGASSKVIRLVVGENRDYTSNPANWPCAETISLPTDII